MADDGFWFTHRLEVRFRDCDAMGHVNHAVYVNGQRLADGKTVNVTYDYATWAIPIPDSTRHLLEQARAERWS